MINWYNLPETLLNCAKDANLNIKNYTTFAVEYYGECWSEEGDPDYRKEKAAERDCLSGICFIILHSVF